MLKRILLSAIVIAIIFSVGAIGPVNAEETVEITFMHRWPDEPDATFYDEVIDIFMEQNPHIKVNVLSYANEPFKERIKIILGTGQAPDVFFSWPGEFTNRFIREGHVMDITEYMEGEWKDSLVESALDTLKVDGSYYGAPMRLDGKVFVYHTEIFDDLGLEKPQTFDEFLEILETIDQAGITPISYGNQGPWAASHYMGQLNALTVPFDIYENDLEPETGDFTHPGYFQAFDKYHQLTPYFNDNANALRHDETRANFMMGNTAMMYMQIVEIPIMEREMSTEFLDDLDMFRMPAIAGAEGDQTALLGYPKAFLVNSGTEHPEEAVELLKFISGQQVGEKMAAELGYVNAYRDVVDQDDVSKLMYAATQLVLDTTRMVNWFDSALHEEIWDVVGADLQRLTDGSITPEEAAENLIEVATTVRGYFE